MQLIESFKVGRFRGLTDVALDGLGQMNLIVGGNNSGKTSILEALGVFSSPLDVVEWSNLARLREARALIASGNLGLSLSDAINWIFPQQGFNLWEPSEKDFSLFATGTCPIKTVHARSAPIHGIPPEPRHYSSRKAEIQEEEEDGWHLTVDVTADVARRTSDQLNLLHLGLTNDNLEHLRLDLDFWPSVGLRFTSRRVGPRVRNSMLSPYSHRNQPMQMGMLSRLISEGSKGQLIDLLVGVDPNLRDLEIVTDRAGRPSLTALLSGGSRVPVSVLGDGFRRALSIAIAVSNSRGGIVMIDEIETAMHVGTLNTLFPWLMNLAIQENVQIFATTHSLEAIQAITSASVAFSNDDVVAFQLSKSSGGASQIRRYSGGTLERVVVERGLDIR
ncbi:AAA family ATPase [Sphingomonas aerolata]|uniref:AAA family ATPase n=1 Tax=Sphingomonas aerolata TaxID=185951 RepID=UPI00336059D6